jgi:hypothetical protein
MKKQRQVSIDSLLCAASVYSRHPCRHRYDPPTKRLSECSRICLGIEIAPEDQADSLECIAEDQWF